MIAPDRFWARVTQGGDCWEWRAERLRGGYGRLRVEGRKMLAHRVAWTLANGPIPDGVFVCHRCDNPPCCNPSHLFLGTHLDNTRDRDRKGRNVNLLGEQHALAKLTAEKVQEIRALTQRGWTRAAIGRRFGVTDRCVASVISGRTWRHLAIPMFGGGT